MSEWKDITSFDRNDKSRTPSVWELQVAPGLRIVITNSHIYYKGIWVTSCAGVNMETVELEVADRMTLEQAQTEAIGRVMDRIEIWRNALLRFPPSPAFVTADYSQEVESD